MEHGPDALRREPVAAPARHREVRHPLRDEERQLAALRGARGPLRDPAARGGARRPAARSSRRPGTSTRTTAPRPPAASRRRPRTTGTSPSRTWCRSPRPASGSRSCGPALPELPRVRRNRLREEWGISDARHAVDPQRGRAGPDRRHRSTPVPTRPPPASGGWASWPAAPTSRASTLDALPITPEQVARVTALVAEGDLNDKLARQVIEGVLAGEGDPGRGRREARSEGRLRRGRARHRRRRGHRRQRRASPTRSAAARWPRPAPWSARS